MSAEPILHRVHGHPFERVEAVEVLRFGLQLPDGTKVTPTSPTSSWLDASPPGPVMHQCSGGGGPTGWRQVWWIWPLPPPGPLDLVCAWPVHGILETRATIDGGAILKAAGRAQVIFSDEHLPEPPGQGGGPP